MSLSMVPPTDIASLWKKASAKFQEMSASEKREILVSAGILTKKGNVTKRYKGVIVPVAGKASAKTK